MVEPDIQSTPLGGPRRGGVGVTSAELYQRVFDDCPDYVTISRFSDGTYIDVNPGFQEFSGYTRAEAVGRTATELGVWPDPVERERFVAHLKEHGYCRALPCTLVRRSGERRSMEVAGSTIVVHGEKILIVVVRDVSERRAVEAQLAQYREHLERLVEERTSALQKANEALIHAHQQLLQSEREAHFRAYHDSLTGLPNRALLNDRLAQLVETAKRKGEALGVLFVDLDDFKKVNDSLGHRVGDAVLSEVSSRLLACVRKSDTVARLGGDEFVVALQGTKDGTDAASVARKIVDALREPVVFEAHTVGIGASVGIATYPHDAVTSSSLLQAADGAMYQAKAKGKNAFEFHSAEVKHAASRRQSLEADLGRAVEQQQFVLHYQPQVNMNTGEIVGLEALVRWQHPSLGLVPPLEFIPLAEESGRIVQIGRMVLRQACRDLRTLRDKGHPQMRVSVNVSPRELLHDHLVCNVTEALRDWGLPPDALDLEITESMVVQADSHNLGVLESLAGLGVRLSVDDFGTGYSGLAYLTSFPLRVLKIDRSFVARLSCGERDAALTGCIIGMARQLGLDVIAEGVETEDQAAALMRQGCVLAQGYHYYRPMTLDDLGVSLDRSSPRI